MVGYGEKRTKHSSQDESIELFIVKIRYVAVDLPPVNIPAATCIQIHPRVDPLVPQGNHALGIAHNAYDPKLFSSHLTAHLN